MFIFNKYYFIAITLIFPSLVFGQVESCDTISQATAWNWVDGNVGHIIGIPGASGTIGDLYLEVEDASGGNSWIRNEIDFAGDWSLNETRNCLCWNYKLLDDNQANSSDDFLVSALKIFSGNWNNPTLSAIFTPTLSVNENESWIQICAPVNLCFSDQLPLNGEGSWAMEIGDGCDDWTELLTTVSGIAFYMEVVNWNGGGEDVGFDDICFETCIPIECSAAFDWSINGCQLTFFNQSTATPGSDWSSWTLYSAEEFDYSGFGEFGEQTYNFSEKDTFEVCLEVVDLNGCVSTACHEVSLDLNSSNNFLGGNLICCDQEYILLSPGNNTLWSDGTISNRLKINTSGSYSAIFTDALGCKNVDTIEIEFIDYSIYTPNAFSPNGDGFNDCFKPLFPHDFAYETYHFSIYDRWGSLVFQTSNPDECWNGEFKGKPLNPGVYVWGIEGQNLVCNNYESLRGSITLLK